MNPKNSHELVGQASACQRPRLGTEPDSERCGIRLRLVHPSAARTALVGRASACQSERSSDFSLLHFAALGALLLLAIPALAATPTTEIKVDQVGYLAGAPKVAMVASKTAAKEFTVRRATGAVVFRAPLPPPVDDPDSGDRVQAADFTALITPGKYYLDIAGVGRSSEFAIGPDSYARAWYLAMRSYYGMRCGTAVDLGPEFPGYRHPACHLEGAWHPSSGKTGPKPPTGGWHDADRKSTRLNSRH